MTEEIVFIDDSPRPPLTAGEIAESVAKLAQEKLDIKNLRDDFAAKAMQGMCANTGITQASYANYAHDSYCMADAMLKARIKEDL